MLRSHLRIAWRNLLRHKSTSAAILLGLLLGVLSSFLLLTYVFDQLSYDRYLPDSDRIYRITSDYGDLGNFAYEKIACCYFHWVHDIKAYFPQVAQLVKFNDPPFAAAKANGKTFRPKHFFVSDSTFFDVFRFRFIRGSREEALRSPMSVVLTEQIARKYFGDMDPIGRTLTLPINDSTAFKYHITGVVENVPSNSHFHPQFVASWPTTWSKEGRGYYYIVLKRGTNVEELKGKLGAFVAAHLPPGQAAKFSLHLQSLTSIHLESHLENELEVNGNITQVYALLIVALFIIGITSINYINLAIARKTGSLKEIGVRRALGAGTYDLVKQNISESAMYVFISVIFAMLFYEPSLLALQKYMNLEIGMAGSWNLYLWCAFVIEVIALCSVSGGYPALMLLGVSSATILNADAHTSAVPLPGIHGSRARRVLIVVQFAAAILLIVAVIIVYQQMKYVSNVNLGYDTEQLIAIPNIPYPAKERYGVFKTELMNQSGVVGVTAATDMPSNKIVDNCQVYVGGGWQNENAPSFQVLPVDRDFIRVMKMKLLAGSSFTKYVPTDQPVPDFGSMQEWQTYFRTTNWVYIINETALRDLGWNTPEEAIGKLIGVHLSGFDFKYGPVIGVVKDFHFTSLHNRIEPIIVFVQPLWFDNVLIRVRTKDLGNTLSNIKKVWGRINSQYPFDYHFVSNVFAAKYRADNQFKVAMGMFSFVAIIVACIGLFAVSSFATERRTKEIGIRKVLGASVPEIVIMLTKDLTEWIILANVIAWPIAYYVMSEWLQGFAYHIDIRFWVFVAAGLIAFLIAVLTVSLQAIRTARANPVKALRYE